MSLRLRLFLLLGVLGVLLALGQWWLIRTLTGDLRGELAAAAAEVGREVVQVLKLPAEEAGGAEGDPAATPGAGEPAEPRRLRVERRMVIRNPGEEPVVTEHVETYDDVGVELSPDERAILLGGPRALTRVPVPAAGVEGAVGEFRRRLLLGSLGLLLLAVLAAIALAGRVAAPLARLAAAAERVGGGELGVAVPEPERAGGGEVGRAIRAFNRMSVRLAALDAAARDARARRHLAELGEVARGLAHSLRNPLNALGLTVDELAAAPAAAPGDDGPGDPRRDELAAAAREQIRRLDAGLRTLLALGDAGASTVEPVDLLAVARDVALEALAAGRDGVRVEVEGDPATVDGVEAELRSAVHALVVNAVEASPPGGEVAVRVERGDPVGGGGARLVVEDRGPGLPPAVRERLFTPHVTTKPAGSGLGLYLAHRLATDRYGGSLELVGREGEDGTRAVLVLGDRVASDGDGDGRSPTDG